LQKSAAALHSNPSGQHRFKGFDHFVGGWDNRRPLTGKITLLRRRKNAKLSKNTMCFYENKISLCWMGLIHEFTRCFFARNIANNVKDHFESLTVSVPKDLGKIIELPE
jgi:hypothetical protein